MATNQCVFYDNIRNRKKEENDFLMCDLYFLKLKLYIPKIIKFLLRRVKIREVSLEKHIKIINWF